MFLDNKMDEGITFRNTYNPDNTERLQQTGTDG